MERLKVIKPTVKIHVAPMAGEREANLVYGWRGAGVKVPL
jgi:hypothetical protein